MFTINPGFTQSRCSVYPNGPERFPVPDNKASWKVSFPAYRPVTYEAPILLKQPFWADKPSERSAIKYNTVDNGVDRTSAHGLYAVTRDHLPLNPMGRTGVTGRGLLGRYGPNHAADPVVTRWKRDAAGKIVVGEGNAPVLQFVAIKRVDCGLWALPGGMVDPGEVASVTVKREFGEEALNALELPKAEAARVSAELDAMFDPKHATVLYQGFVDDPRNTDNSWMETTVVNVHDSSGKVFDKFTLQGGDDASHAMWVDYKPGMPLYASHGAFMNLAYQYRLNELHASQKK